MQTKPLIVVAGGTGFIGSHVLQVLANSLEQLDVLVLGRNQQKWDENFAQIFPGFRFHSLDLTDLSQIGRLNEILAVYPADTSIYILNLAAWNYSASTGVKNPLLMLGTNVVISYILNQVARILGGRLKKFLEVSSSRVFADTQADIVYQADDLLNATDHYGASKVIAETLYEHSHFVDGVPVTVARVGNVLTNPIGVYMQIWNAAVSSTDGTAFFKIGSLRNKRTLLSVDAAVSGLLTILFRGKPGEVYNLCGDDAINLGEFITLVEKVTKVRFSIQQTAKQTRPTMLMDNGVVHSLGWTDTTDIEAELRRLLANR